MLSLAVATAGTASYSPEEIAEESAKANAFFNEKFDSLVAESPEFSTFLGLKKDYDKWDDDSEAAAVAKLGRTVKNYEELLRTINYDKLDRSTKVSYRLWVRGAENSISGWKWRNHNYPINQLFGQQANIPAFMINSHRVDTADDARAYVSRLRGLDVKFGHVIRGITEREAAGIMPPKFVFPYALQSSRDVITGSPFDDSGKDSALYADIRAKVAKLTDLTDEEKATVIEEARAALVEVVAPAYRRLIATLEDQAMRATDDDGVWKFPEGVDFYNRALFSSTTTHYTADEIHEIGLSEVRRLLDAIDGVRVQVGFKGDRKAFTEFMRNDPQFFLPATEEGRQEYLNRVTTALDAIRVQLPKIFRTLPRAELTVKAVEAFREKGAANAFYQRPTPDGRLPGIYYVNFSNMSGLPLHEMEATAYHEGLPGHHMQIAIAGELEGLPKFRRYGFGATAYTEGWGLYAEQLGKELGGYADPYSEFGRLSLELMRAGRLVADTGIHSRHWTREQAIDWLVENTPLPLHTIRNEVERYIVIPGQATAYKIGQLKILELRVRAETAFGDKFDLAGFHDVVLRNGPVPLEILDEFVNEWIAEQNAS